MTLSEILRNVPWIVIVSAFGGAGLTLLVQRWRQRRGIFTYRVHHNMVGISSDSPLYGSVAVTWNNDPVERLFFSTIELTNESVQDYEAIVVHVFSDDTALLSASATKLESIEAIGYSDDYEKVLARISHRVTTERLSGMRWDRDRAEAAGWA